MELNLQGNPLTAAGLTALSGGLAVNKAITTLDIQDVGISEHDVTGLLAVRCLRRLLLSQNPPPRNLTL